MNDSQYLKLGTDDDLLIYHLAADLVVTILRVRTIWVSLSLLQRLNY